MQTLFVLSWMSILLLPTWSEAIKGKGYVYFTYSNSYQKTGLRTVYRPDEQYQSLYSDSGDPSAFLATYQLDYPIEDGISSAENITASNYSEWKVMKWDQSGWYYYNDNYEINITPGHYISYEAKIYHFGNVLVYEDSHNIFLVPSHIEYCKINANAHRSDYKCSRALDNKGIPTTTQIISLQTVTRVSSIAVTRVSSIGYIIGLGILSCCAMGCCSMLCKRLRRCRCSGTHNRQYHSPQRSTPTLPDRCQSTSSQCSARERNIEEQRLTNQQRESSPPDPPEDIPPPYELAVRNLPSAPLEHSTDNYDEPPSYMSVAQPFISSFV